MKYSDDVLIDFENNRMSIIEAYLEPVLEAEDVSSVDDASNKLKNTNKFRVMITKAIETLAGIISRFTLKCKNIFQNIMQTDTGFKSSARNAIVDNKPLEAIKLIAYDYDDSFIDNQLNRISSEIIRLITSAKTSYVDQSNPDIVHELDMSEDKLYSIIFKKAGFSDVGNLSTYFLKLKTGYRRQKKEILFKSSETEKYYHIALSKDILKKKIDEQQHIISQQAATVKANLKNTINNNNTQDYVKKRAMSQFKNITHLFNFYTSFLNMYVQLKIEKNLMYRTVLKKLYHF